MSVTYVLTLLAAAKGILGRYLDMLTDDVLKREFQIDSLADRLKISLEIARYKESTRDSHQNRPYHFNCQNDIRRHYRRVVKPCPSQCCGLNAYTDRLSTERSSRLPESLCAVLMMEDLEKSLGSVKELPLDFYLDDHTVYKDSHNREIIIPAYMNVGIQALRGMDLNNCQYGCQFGFQVSYRLYLFPREFSVVLHAS